MDEELKKALECCIYSECAKCPLYPEPDCFEKLEIDIENYITSLEERIAIMQESMEALEKRCKALDVLEQRCKALGKDPDHIKVTRCKDCEHATMTTDGRFCKYCDLVTDDDGCEKRVNYDANWYCGSAERVSE